MGSSMNCQQCKTPLEETAKFCPQCGKGVEERKASSTLREPGPKKDSSIWFKVLLSLVIIIVGGFLLHALLAEDLTDTVENQLNAIRKGKVTEAYYTFTSKGFQEATTLEEFNTFIKTHSAFLTNQAILFKERNVDNDTGTLEGVIMADGDQKTLVDYKLVKENDQWKILSIRLEDFKSDVPEKNEIAKPSTAPSKSPSLIQFPSFSLGSHIDSSGIVHKPSLLFNANSGDIYLNLRVSDALGDEEVKITLVHLSTKSTLNPVTTHLSEPGESLISFVFSPPKEGWPKGAYRIKAQASTGATGFVDFNIDPS